MKGGLLDIPMKLTPPEDEASKLPPVGAKPKTKKSTPASAFNVPAPESKLSGGTWERLGPGQFAYHPSEQDLALPDLIEHFTQIEVVGDLLIMPDGSTHEGGISHDVDADGVLDTSGKNSESALSGDVPSNKPSSKLAMVGQPASAPESINPATLKDPSTSWENKRGPSFKVPNPTKHY